MKILAFFEFLPWNAPALLVCLLGVGACTSAQPTTSPGSSSGNAVFMEARSHRTLPIVLEITDGSRVRVAHADADARVLYAWKGVVLSSEEIWGRERDGRPQPFSLKDFKVIEVDPPVDYIIGENGLALAGYSHPQLGWFVCWRDAYFNPSRLPQELIGQKCDRDHGRNGGPLRLFWIKPPVHRAALARQFAETLPGTSIDLGEVPPELSAYLPRASIVPCRLADGRIAVGYLHARIGIYYRWRGVRLRQTDKIHPQIAPVLDLPKLLQRFAIVDVDPELRYTLDESGLATPGHFSAADALFLQWKGVRFAPMHTEPDRLGQRLDLTVRAAGRQVRVIEIEVPAHRLDEARQLNASAADVGRKDRRVATNLKWILRLPAVHIPMGAGMGTVGYFDGDRNVLYQWRAIMVPAEWIWDPAGISAPGKFQRGPDCLVVEIDPPVDFILTAEGRAEPGYFDSGISCFYRWRGVQFNLSRAPRRRLGILRESEATPRQFRIRDVDVPAHLKNFADELNRTATTRPGK